MDIRFASKELEACASETARAARKWGPVVGDRYIQRLVVIAAAPTFESLYAIRFLRLHRLTGDRKGSYAVTLQDRWRLVFSRHGREQILIEEVANHYGD